MAHFKLTILVSILALLSLGGCKSVPDGSSINHEAALKEGERFMFDLTNNQIGESLDEMESGFTERLDREKAIDSIRMTFQFCGRPLASRYRSDETGFKIYPDGSMKPMRKFYFDVDTSQYPKGVCSYSVSIVPDRGGLKVTEFQPLKMPR